MPVRRGDVIIREVVPFDICKAVAASMWKSAFIRDTFVRNRQAFEKYQRSVMGDLAKLCVKRWLEENNFECIDWDDVRENWRTQRKQFDLKVNDHEIEIRSSISPHRGISTVLRSEHIIQPCNVKLKEITAQVFFPDTSCTSTWLFGWAYKNDLGNRALRSPRYVGRRLVDFYLMPFTHPDAHPMRDLLSVL